MADARGDEGVDHCCHHCQCDRFDYSVRLRFYFVEGYVRLDSGVVDLGCQCLISEAVSFCLGLDEGSKGGALAEVGVNALLSSRIDCASSINETRVEDELSA